MKVKIYPSKNKDYIKVPSSKSLTHRAIIVASLADGRSKISNVIYSDDIKATISAVKSFGAKVIEQGDTLVIDGIKNFNNASNHFNASASGSTLRFMIPIFSLLEREVIITGTKKLFTRPLKVYENIYKAQNLLFSLEEDHLKINGKIKPDNYKVEGNISSQFISGLLFTLPLLEKDSTIEIIPPLESKSYVDMTIELLKLSGISINKENDLKYYIKGNQKYNPIDYYVEGDYSQMAFFAVLGSINSSINIVGLNHQSSQGDKEIINILKNMGVNIKEIENGYYIEKSIPSAIDIDIKNVPDLGPILSVLAANSLGTTKIYNAKRLRIKESDRISDLEEELKKLDVKVSSTENEIIITGNKNYQTSQIINTHEDHRILMSMAIFATILDKPLIIDNYECVNKSYPDFLSDLENLGIKIEYI